MQRNARARESNKMMMMLVVKHKKLISSNSSKKKNRTTMMMTWIFRRQILRLVTSTMIPFKRKLAQS
jgi:hypothetical protein